MTTTTRSPVTMDTIDLDPSGVPLAGSSIAPPGRLPGIAHGALLVDVQRVEPPRLSDSLVWGVADGRTVLFLVDEVMARELQAALDAGHEPSAIVEPAQVVAMEIEPDLRGPADVHSVAGR